MPLATLLMLGLALSLDSFRVSLCLGARKLRPLQQAQIAVAFGLCDGFAPLLGILLGRSLFGIAGEMTKYLGPMFLGGYGAYVVCVARRYKLADNKRDSSHWIVFGLPLSLSLDNLIAGASLGMMGFPLPLSVAVIGSISAVASMAGLQLGRMAVKIVGDKAELLGGGALVCIAFVLAMETS